MPSTSHDRDASSVEKSRVEVLGSNNETQPPATKGRSRFANPTPAGLFMFASSTFLISMYNVNARGIHTPNAITGMALFGGGLVQILAGTWEFARGNVFGATTFSSYGAFWMSYSAILIPGTGVHQAYSTEAEFHNAYGMYLIVWFMVTMMFILPTLPRKHLAMTLLLSCLAIDYLLLAISEFSGMISIQRAGGAFGIITAFVAYYIASSDLLAADENPFIVLPQGIWTN
ncbi:Gpr1 family protein [Collybia nuda]|uniref:Gpr1 family protein n=1 Tax=Collybia nuda TaxID=64659 RepID=A0A9P5Y9N8_9AGAR|nr:Gpr1 family protein [Collybia nuda]